MRRSSDFADKECPLDLLFDEMVRRIIEAQRDWRRPTITRPGDDRKMARAA